MLHALAHNSIAFFNTILPHSLSNDNSHCYARSVPAMSAGKEGWEHWRTGGGGGGALAPPNKIQPWLIFNVPTKY